MLEACGPGEKTGGVGSIRGLSKGSSVTSLSLLSGVNVPRERYVDERQSPRSVAIHALLATRSLACPALPWLSESDREGQTRETRKVALPLVGGRLARLSRKM